MSQEQDTQPPRPGEPRRPVQPPRHGASFDGPGAPPPPPGYPPVLMPPQRQPRESWASLALRRLLSTVLILSIMLNLFFILAQAGSHAGQVQETVYAEGDRTQRIVIVPIDGPIFELTDQFMHDALRHLESDLPRAVILRVDSPGGGVAASDRIAERLRRFQEEAGIPLIASYGGEAASGAYYISAACDRIVAEPTCITGSIGVIMPAFTIEQLLAKLGITPRTLIAQGADRKDVGSITRAWTEEDRLTLQVIIDQMHARFVQVVIDGRGLTTAQAAAAANGAPLTAAQALDLKLIDEIGYLATAIDRAAEAADIPSDTAPQVTILKVRTGLGSLLPLGKRGATGLAALDEQWQRGLAEAVAGRLPLFMRPGM